MPLDSSRLVRSPERAMLPSTVFPGIYAASLTPLRPDLSVDEEVLAGHVRWLLSHGCDGVVLLGSTGEAASFSTGERMALLEGLLAAGLAPDRLVVGTGTTALPETVLLTRHAVGLGVGGVLVLPPYYYRPVRDEGLFVYFDRLIQAVGSTHLRIILYHYPRLTGVPFTDAVLTRLVAAHPGTIVGMKDSGGDVDHMRAVCRAFPGFQLFAGTERHLLDVVRAGGAGCISATVNVTCPLAAAVYACRGAAQAEALQARLTAARQALEAFPFVPALKQLLAERTGDAGWMRLRPPLVPLCTGEREALLRLAPAFPFLSDPEDGVSP